MAPDLATPAGWLPVVFMTLMGLALLLYVVLDGYDLGVGILLPGGSDAEKDVMVGAIGPFWDANETWLVLGIGILLVAFPVAHGIVLSSLYLPVVLMLIGLTLRGVAFDFRVKVHASHKPLWNWLFFAGFAHHGRGAGLDAGRLHHRLCQRRCRERVLAAHYAVRAGSVCVARCRLAVDQDHRTAAGQGRALGTPRLVGCGGRIPRGLAGIAAGE